MPALASASPEHIQKSLLLAGRIARSVASIPDPHEMMQRVVDLVGQELGNHFVGVYLVDEDGQWLTLSAAYGVAGARLISEGHKLAVGGNSMAGLAARMRMTRLVDDLDADADYLRNAHLHLVGTQSEMALPMVVGNDLIGVLSVQNTLKKAFFEEDVTLLQVCADQLAVAIRHNYTHRLNHEFIVRSERRARLFHAASEVGKQVTSILDLDELLPHMCDIIVNAYGFYYAGVFLLDETGEWAVLRAGYGEAGRTMLEQGHKLSVGGHSMIGTATALGEARIALDVGDERVHFKNPVLPHTRSEMALPLQVGKKILGAVTVQSIEERAFSSDDILTLQTMADQLAVAINNARLLKDLEHANADLLRTKTYEALTAATTTAIHWIGNKALPITTTVARMQADVKTGRLDAESLAEDLELVAENARMIVDVKENLLGQAREQKPRPAMLSDIAQAAAFYADVPEGIFHLSAAADVPLAVIDSVQVARALRNLYLNALEAGARHISAEVLPLGHGLVGLRIADDGEGIPPEIFNKMWAPFVSSRMGHSGLGLTAALHIITQQHGQIRAISQPGEGAIFEIELPADSQSHPVQEIPAHSPSVLLLDDDDAWAQFAVQAVAAIGGTVTRRADLKDVELKRYDWVLLDEALESADAESLLSGLKAGGVLNKTIVISAAPSVERAGAWMRAGVKDVALKPYTPLELSELLH